MPNLPKTQAVNLTFAWLGASLILPYCVKHDVLAHVPLTSLERITFFLGIAAMLIAFLKLGWPAWVARSLCFALGSICTIITVLATS